MAEMVVGDPVYCSVLQWWGPKGGNKSPLTVYHTWLSKTIVTVVHCDCKDYFRGNKGKAE